MNTVHENILRYGWDADGLRGACHSESILSRAEDLNPVVLGSESLHAFVGLLTIIQGGGHAMDAKVRVSDELRCGPFSTLDTIMRLDMASDLICKLNDTN